MKVLRLRLLATRRYGAAGLALAVILGGLALVPRPAAAFFHEGQEGLYPGVQSPEHDMGRPGFRKEYPADTSREQPASAPVGFGSAILNLPWLREQTGLPAGQGTPSQSVIFVIKGIINVILGISAAIALLAVVIGGVFYILSFGNEERTRTAKNTIIYALIGLIVVAAAFVIVNLVKQLL